MDTSYLEQRLKTLQKPSKTERALQRTGRFLQTPLYAGQYVGKRFNSQKAEIATQLGLSFTLAAGLYAIEPILVVLAFTQNLGPYFEKAAKKKEESRLEKVKSLEFTLQSLTKKE